MSDVPKVPGLNSKTLAALGFCTLLPELEMKRFIPNPEYVFKYTHQEKDYLICLVGKFMFYAITCCLDSEESTILDEVKPISNNPQLFVVKVGSEATNLE